MDCANEAGRFLILRIFGKYGRKTDLFIPFGKGGSGWLSLASLLMEICSTAPPSKFIPKSTKSTVVQKWEDEVLIVVRNHNSRLSWEDLEKELQLELFSFSQIKAAAPVGSKEVKLSWLQKRLLTVKGEKVYFNNW